MGQQATEPAGPTNSVMGRMLEAIGFFALVEAVGLAAAPLAALAFGRMPGAGLGFAKPLGLLLVAWAVWLLGSFGVPYATATIIAVAVALALAGAAAALRQRTLAEQLRGRPEPGGRFARWRMGRIAARALPAEDPARRPLWIGAEVVFLVAFAAMALLVAYSPDVWGTEKPMDMAFVNAINASDRFPPHDPWMSGTDLNYYYLGHLAMALPIRVLGLAPDHGYNLALALLFGLAAAAVFTLAGTLWAAARATRPDLRGGPVAAGVAAVAVCLVLGNLAGVKAWLDAANPPGGYDWFAASRVIPGAIDEFPWFSFLLGDLHAHVLAIPFFCLALAFAVQVVLVGPRGDVVWRGTAEALAAGLAVGALYAINSWSYPVAAGLLVIGVLAWLRDPRSSGRRGYAATWIGLVLLASVVLLLPFWLSFDPAARGLGVVRHHAAFGRYLGQQALIYGVLAWIVLSAFAARLLAAAHPWRTAAWSTVAAVFAGTLLALGDLAGPAVLVAMVAVALGALASPRMGAPERALWLLIAGGVTCVVLPDVVYLRDAFDGGPFYRMNTVFKFGYHGWLLLALAAGCALPWAAAWLPRRAWPVWALGTVVGLLLAAVYPYAGTYARKDAFRDGPTLDGLSWLRIRAPGDLPAISWIRAHTPGSAVVLEGFGPDYSAFGHARISTFTGRATVLGWAGHEIQWSHDPGSREADVKTLYTTTDAAAARVLLARYGVAYVVVGPIERTDYGDAGVAKWDALGRRVFDREGTTVWALSASTPRTPASPRSGSTAGGG
jgi:YYY domain-containing protein